MGIHGLTKLLSDNAPSCIKENEIKNYFGRKIAIDASMSIYQFLIATQGPEQQQGLTDETGETTSHLSGIFYRTIRMINNGIKPVFVFDGKPPKFKSDELAKRKERREEAEKSLEEAKEVGTSEEVNKFSKRTIRVTPQHNEEAKKLLRLMGVPVVNAPCEAEAQCAVLAAGGKVYATGSEDMDSLTLATPILLRHLTFSEARKMPIKEIHLSSALQELGLNMDEFIDLCILLGCDYCGSIKGIGPVRALELIRKHRCIEEVLKHLDRKKYVVPEPFPFEEVRELFKHPEVIMADQIELKWNDPDREGLIKFMVEEKNFNRERIEKGIEKLFKARTTSVQNRLTNYFGAPVTLVKRKSDDNSKGKKSAKTDSKKKANDKKKKGPRRF